jgi:hypothetical protein
VGGEITEILLARVPALVKILSTVQCTVQCTAFYVRSRDNHYSTKRTVFCVQWGKSIFGVFVLSKLNLDWQKNSKFKIVKAC